MLRGLAPVRLLPDQLLLAAFDHRMGLNILGNFGNYDWLEFHARENLLEAAEHQGTIDRLQPCQIVIHRAQSNAVLVAVAILEVMEVLPMRFFLLRTSEVLHHRIFDAVDFHLRHRTRLVFRMLALGRSELLTLWLT